MPLLFPPMCFFAYLEGEMPLWMFGMFLLVGLTVFSILSLIIYLTFKVAYISQDELILKNIISNKISIKVKWLEIKSIRYYDFIFYRIIRFDYFNENGVSKSGRFQFDKYSKNYLEDILNQNNLELN